MTIRNPRLLGAVVVTAAFVPLAIRWICLETVLSFFNTAFARRIFRAGEQGSDRGILYVSTLFSAWPLNAASRLCVMRTLLFFAVCAPFSSHLSVISGVRQTGKVIVGHCWLEDQGVIRGDTIATCSLYTPIISYRAPFAAKQLVV